MSKTRVASARFIVQLESEPLMKKSDSENVPPAAPKKLPLEGRYTLKEVIDVLSKRANEDAIQMEHKVTLAVHKRSLPVYLPNKHARYLYEDHDINGKVSVINLKRERVYWDDVNAWLDREEPRITFRFPDPSPNVPNLKQHAKVKPVPAQRAQESEILRVIGQLGLEPMKLPPIVGGKPGAKAAVREELEYPGGVFNKAWQRLLSDHRIGYAKK